MEQLQFELTNLAEPVIISHRHRFIFMHCRKVAGSSIAACLAPFLGPDDLHLGTWPEAFDQGVRPNRRARRAGTCSIRWLRQASLVACYAARRKCLTRNIASKRSMVPSV